MKNSTARAPSSRVGLNYKLLGYSTTAGAALLLAPAAHAQQTYNITLFNENGGAFSASPPTFSGADADFSAEASVGGSVFKVEFELDHAGGFASIAVNARGGGGIVSAGGYPVNLGRKSIVGTHTFGNGGELAFRTVDGFSGGNFRAHGNSAVASGYLGFKTSHGHNGWLKLQVTNDGSGSPLSVTFVKGDDGLYGQIGGPGVETDGVSAIPEPADVASGLGLLALGAVGVREMRRRRKVAV
jgi:hypothetical protein